MNRDETKENNAKRRRRSIRLVRYDYTAGGAYFITAVTAGRKGLFGEIESGEMCLSLTGRIVQSCWEQIPTHFPHVGVDAYVIMPNHIHGILLIYNDHTKVGAQHAAPLQNNIKKPNQKVEPGSLGAIVRSFKSAVTRQVRREMNLTTIWQRNYYEHIIRNPVDYEKITAYILDNPRNWQDDEEYPQQK